MMKTIVYGDSTYECDAVYADGDFITGYLKQQLIIRAPIKYADFSGEFDLDEQTVIHLALAEIAEAQEQDKTDIQLALTELAELIIGGA